MSEEEAHEVLRMAVGRLFKLGSRLSRPGDVEEYERIRRAALDAGDVLGITAEYRSCVASDVMRHRARYGDSG